jgi:predicted DNA-binding transcriptional regulator AlpA
MPTSKKARLVSKPKARIVSKPEVLERVGVTYPTIWTWMREGKFPRSRELGGKSCWLEHEIEEWILSRPVRRLKGDQPVNSA